MSIVDGGNAFSTYDIPVTPISSATGVTLMGRKIAESLMTSTCVIVRDTNATATDPTTGVDTPVFQTIYSGPCRLRMQNADARNETAAGQSIEVQHPVLSLPVLATGSNQVQPDDVATITSPLDPAPVVARIAGVHSQTNSTARRFPVEIKS